MEDNIESNENTLDEDFMLSQIEKPLSDNENTQLNKKKKFATRTITQSKMLEKEAFTSFSQLKSKEEVYFDLNRRYPELGVGRTFVNTCYSTYRDKVINNYSIKKSQHYLKESLINYERILDSAQEIENITKQESEFKEALSAQKNQLQVIKDRNSLLGLDRQGVNIELNFTSNVDETSFIKGQSKVIDENPEESGE